MRKNRAVLDPTRTTALTNGYQVVKSFRYLLTDPRQFDILQSGPWLAGIERNSIIRGAAAYPLSARAQQGERVRPIGVTP